jgi:hypothetical protein
MRDAHLKRIARRLARPLTSPLDGRVADINRRVTDASLSIGAVDDRVAGLTHDLDDYAAATAESNAYLAAEMRRWEESLDVLRTHIDTHEERVVASIGSITAAIEIKGHVEYLRRVAEAPLEQLDGAVANLLNYAGGHRGFAAQAGLWFNPAVGIEFGEGSARLTTVNERIVENPFAFRALSRLTPPARILEIGSAESTFSLSAASLGYDVTALDLHPLPYKHPHLESIVGRFEEWDPGDTRFDAAFLISTIEHIGLGAYGETVGRPGADRAALTRVAELLNDDGILVLTTPYGLSRVDALERTYDDESLAALLKGWRVIERHTIQRREGRTWTNEDPASPGQDDEPGVVMVVATPARHA